jgi:hypothetical protein
LPTFFIIFIFVSLLGGAGLLLSPALPTRQPRIGLAAVACLGIVTVLGVNYAAVVRWQSIVFDYLWFGLLVGVFLSGTFSLGMFRAEVEGHRETGWPGPRELGLLMTLALLFVIAALIFPVPLDTDAQGFGYLALTLRQSGSLTTLAPFHSEIQYLYSPGFLTVAAYLSNALGAGLQNVQLALGAVFSLLFVWSSYDLGNEIADDSTRRTGIAFALAAVIGTGLLLADLDSHYTTLMALDFALACLVFSLRWVRGGKRLDFLLAAITLAGVPLTHPDTTIILILGYVPWLAVIWLSKPRPSLWRWLGLAVGIPGLALLLIVPWLLKIAPLLGSDIASIFEIEPRHIVVMLVYHGGVIVLLALGGALLGLRRRNFLDLMMIVWLLLILDFSSLGILPRLAGFVLAPILKYDYPFSIAWHGPIIPYTYLGGTVLLWLAERFKLERRLVQISTPLMVGAALVLVLVGMFSGSLVAWSKNTPLRIFGAFSSQADVRAMEWLRANTPKTTLILNHPGPQEGDWVPVIAERDAVYFRPQPFFRGTATSDARQTELMQFWQHPENVTNVELLRKYGIEYVIVPQIVAAPARLPEMFRWRPPFPEAILNVNLKTLPYLELVFEADGAQVYKLKP